MLRIRFQRIGKKHQPFLRLVVVDKEAPPKGGRFEKVGWWNPLTKERKLQAERIKYWLSVGAQPTDRVYNWLVDEGIVSGGKKAVHARQKKVVEEEKAPAAEGKAPEKKEDKSVEEKKEETSEGEKEQTSESSEEREEKADSSAEKKEEKKEEPESKKEAA
jgi:small subunit ribosomal protein S16